MKKKLQNPVSETTQAFFLVVSPGSSSRVNNQRSDKSPKDDSEVRKAVHSMMANNSHRIQSMNPGFVLRNLGTSAESPRSTGFPNLRRDRKTGGGCIFSDKIVGRRHKFSICHLCRKQYQRNMSHFQHALTVLTIVTITLAPRH